VCIFCFWWSLGWLFLNQGKDALLPSCGLIPGVLIPKEGRIAEAGPDRSRGHLRGQGYFRCNIICSLESLRMPCPVRLCQSCRKRTSRPSSKCAIEWTLSFVGTFTKTFLIASWSWQTARPLLRSKLRSKAGNGGTANRSSTQENSPYPSLTSP
jgi:hypothetical protein